MSLGVLRGIVLVISACGIAGMIVGTVATDNNNGVVITFGIVTAVAVLTLIASTMVVKSTTARDATARGVTDGTVDETLAAHLEERIRTLVAAGADEEQVRALVGEAVRLGKSAT
jgi:hypothetical protein